MQDRLAELRRQRALVADHLAWLDREIAATPASTQPPANPEPNSIGASAAPAAVQPGGAKRLVMLGGKLVAIRPEHSVLSVPDPAHIKMNVRRGCFLYVALAAILVVLGGALLVWASQEYKARHPPAPRQMQVEEP